MARVKGAMMTRKRRNKVLKLAKSYWGSKSRHFKMAKRLRICRPQAEEARVPQPVDHPYLRGCRSLRHQLFPFHVRPEEVRHRDEPQGSVRAGHHRSRGVQDPRRDREEGSVIYSEHKAAAGDACGRSIFSAAPSERSGGAEKWMKTVMIRSSSRPRLWAGASAYEYISAAYSLTVPSAVKTGSFSR